MQGGKIHTIYTWDWGDGTPNKTMTGYEANHNQSHTYSFPGTYTIVITATNEGGSASVAKTITVLGQLYI